MSRWEEGTSHGALSQDKHHLGGSCPAGPDRAVAASGQVGLFLQLEVAASPLLASTRRLAAWKAPEVPARPK